MTQTLIVVKPPTWLSENYKWLLASIPFIGAPLYLAVRPTEYTPLVEVLLNLLLFVLAYMIGSKKEVDEAAKKANDRWLPQAEAVVYRLITLHSHVKNFSVTTSCNSQKTESDLPELNGEQFKALKIKLKTDCENTSIRLEEMANQLDDAISDWTRFIAANCSEDECGRIFEAIDERRKKLESKKVN